MSSHEITLSLVIPAFNEAERLPGFLEEATTYLRAEFGSACEVIVVDDGSRDDTASLAEAAFENWDAGQVIRLPQNAGKGAAVRAGMLAARGDFCLFADADGATPIAEERKLRTALTRGADVAIGSRAKGGTRQFIALGKGEGAAPVADTALWNVRLHRHLLGRVFSALIRTLVGLPYADTQCGFKMFRHRVVAPLWSRLGTAGFAFDVELLVRAQELSLRVEEVGVRWSEKPGSKVRLGADSVQMLRDVLTLKLAPLRQRTAQAFAFLLPAANRKS